MILRAVLPAAFVVLSPAANADDLSGWWGISSGFRPPARQTAPSDGPAQPGVAFATPNQSVTTRESDSGEPVPANSCGFDGQLMLKEIADHAEGAECSLTLTHTCSYWPGSHLTILQTCTVTRAGNTVTIKGKDPLILEAAPAQLWPKSYLPDTFTLDLSADEKSMRGESSGNARVFLSKIADLVE